MKHINLTQGKIALVDDEEYEELSQHKWYAKRGTKTFYAARDTGSRHNRKRLRMHRVIMGAEDGQYIDHINRNGLDNRKANLRFATVSQNQHNRPHPKNSTSGYKGISWHKIHKRWQAHITVKGQYYWLGSFTSKIEAVEAYDKKARELVGNYAYKKYL